MNCLYVILSILLIILIILILPINVIFLYEENLIIKLRLLFFTYTIFSGEHDSQDSNETDNNTTDNQNTKNDDSNTLHKASIKKILSRSGFSGFMRFLSDILRLGTSIIQKIIKRTTIKKLELDISVGDEDSASTAIKYGQVCAMVYPLLSIITQKNIPRIYNINVFPDYNSKKCSVKLHLHIYARLFYILYTTAFFIKKYIQTIKTKQY